MRLELIVISVLVLLLIDKPRFHLSTILCSRQSPFLLRVCKFPESTNTNTVLLYEVTVIHLHYSFYNMLRPYSLKKTIYLHQACKMRKIATGYQIAENRRRANPRQIP